MKKPAEAGWLEPITAAVPYSLLDAATALPYMRGHAQRPHDPTFERQARAAGLSDDEVEDICAWLGENPRAGDVIPGSGGARKVRFAGRGKGKSGGYRTVHFYAGEDVPVFALALVSKGQRADLSRAERNELAKLLPEIAAAYRAGVRAKVLKLRRRK